MSRLPVATVASDSKNRTVWRVQWPTGKTYYATTYPNSELLYLETGATRRNVAAGQATKLMPVIRDAIERAKSQHQVEP